MWESSIITWYQAFSQKNRLIIYYDELISNTKNILLKALNFLNFTVSEDIINCVIENKHGNFKREEKMIKYAKMTKYAKISKFDRKMLDYLCAKQRHVYVNILGRSMDLENTFACNSQNKMPIILFWNSFFKRPYFMMGEGKFNTLFSSC